MRFRLYREYGALNSVEIFNAFSKGIRSLGHSEVTGNEDVSVIWSVLWKGRMRMNRSVYEAAKKQGKPVIIIEVGNLKRGITWRICMDNINGAGEFSSDENLDPNRPRFLGVDLQSTKNNRKNDILICSQLPESLQWQDMPTMEQWIKDTVDKIRKFTDRKIIIRPHPRSFVRVNVPGCQTILPKKLPGTYDDFDIDYNYHCVINHNSGPAVQAAIFGTPVICDSTSLAYPVSDQIENIEKITLPDREQWFLKLCHTEWTVEEIAAGTPLKRLLKKIEKIS
jgi:hypothetical protein